MSSQGPRPPRTRTTSSRCCRPGEAEGSGQTSPTVKNHARASVSPWTPGKAWGFLEALLASPGFDLLLATQRHAAVLAQTLTELPDVRGNLFHDLQTAVLMREHGISRICTRDTDFHRFPFLTVVDPMRS